LTSRQSLHCEEEEEEEEEEVLQDRYAFFTHDATKEDCMMHQPYFLLVSEINWD